MLSAKNEEILRQKEEIESQKDEIETQRDMVVVQKDMLENVHGKLTDSLRYAQSIQAAILPSENVLKQISSQYFVIMKPCEMVSGDFFWATVFDDYQVFCVADCTGHGVPGAFMSVLGITALNDIVARHRVTKANEILGYLRASVVEALGQNDPKHIHKDGLDISLCVLNTKKRELQFAGAGLPLWIVMDVNEQDCITQNLTPEITHKNFVLYEVKGDIMPVGQSPRMEPFTNHTLSLENWHPAIYLTTDGFADQIGGQSKIKFGAARLKRLIVESAHKEFSAQKKVLEQSFEHWQGLNYQVDDVAVLGLKVIV
jgi:serine phosphatase RsbU (regulator of sigma subunit)